VSQTPDEVWVDVIAHNTALRSGDPELMAKAFEQVPISSDHYVLLHGLFWSAICQLAPVLGYADGEEAMRALALNQGRMA
jgi:hypothetical protein